MNFADREAVASVDMRLSDTKNSIVNHPGIHFIDLRIMMGDLKLDKKDFTNKDIEKLCETIVEVVNKTNAKRVVLDSITALLYRLKNDEMIRQFIFRLGSFLGLMEAGVFLVGEGENRDSASYGVEGFISDGVIRLSTVHHGKEAQRTLEIVKMRGMNHDSTTTSFRISPDGIKLFPRMRRKLGYQVSNKRISTGVSGLDEMSGGGFIEGSSVAVMGPSGTGKSITCLHFIMAGLRKGENCLIVSFEESHDQLLQNAGTFGFNLKKYEATGQLKFITVDMETRSFDEHIDIIINTATETKSKRIVVDSLSAVGNELGAESLRDFSSTLVDGFKTLGATTLLTLATEGFLGGGMLSESHVSAFVDTIVLFRFVEIESELRRAVIIVKMRSSDHDKKMREVIISGDGINISTDFSGYEGVLSGVSRKVGESISEQLRLLFLEILGPMGERIFIEAKKKGLSKDKVKVLIDELGSQGILSVRRKGDFASRAETIFNPAAE